MGDLEILKEGGPQAAGVVVMGMGENHIVDLLHVQALQLLLQDGVEALHTRIDEHHLAVGEGDQAAIAPLDRKSVV